MNTFHYEMSRKWFFTFMNFQNVYWHGKAHSAMYSTLYIQDNKSFAKDHKKVGNLFQPFPFLFRFSNSGKLNFPLNPIFFPQPPLWHPLTVICSCSFSCFVVAMLYSNLWICSWPDDQWSRPSICAINQWLLFSIFSSMKE